MKQVEKGDTKNVYLNPEKDEFGVISKQFNSMLNALENSQGRNCKASGRKK